MRAPAVALVPATDGALVQAIRTGGPLAAAPVCAILRPGIESTLLRVLRGRPQEFEDLLQITYERVIRTVAAGNFEGRSQLKTWAGAIAAHVATDYLRRKSYEARLFEGLGADSIDPPLPTRTPEGQLDRVNRNAGQEPDELCLWRPGHAHAFRDLGIDRIRGREMGLS